MDPMENSNKLDIQMNAINGFELTSLTNLDLK